MTEITAHIMLFDTCTHKCAYCHYAESGKVLDSSQLRPYSDPVFIERFSSFFLKRMQNGLSWWLLLTGGEPLLMPNFKEFMADIEGSGNRVSVHTALLVGDDHPGLNYLLTVPPIKSRKLYVSFHPEAEPIEDTFFDRLDRLKNAGNDVECWFVAHPARLHRMEALAARCQEIGVPFWVMPFYSNDYPAAYTKEEKDQIEQFIVSPAQFISLNNGVDTSNVTCNAGHTTIEIDMRTGSITPCVSVSGPVIGNIYDDTLMLSDKPQKCAEAGKITCNCPTLTEHAIVGAAEPLWPKGAPRDMLQPISTEKMAEVFAENGFSFGEAKVNMGLTETWQKLALDTQTVKNEFKRNKDYYHGEYAVNNHPFFKTRQFADN